MYIPTTQEFPEFPLLPVLLPAALGMTVDQIKHKFRQNGMTFTQWALDHGYKPNKVIRVVNGFDKGNYGAAHTIAVKLGMKSETAV